MQIVNDYDKEVYNGDIGYIVDVDPEAGELASAFDGRSVTYGFGELDTFLCRHYPQEPGLRISRRDHPCPHPALRNAAAKSPLYRRHARQEAGGPRRSKEGHRHRGSQRLGPATLVEARRMASARRALPIVEFIEGGLNSSKAD
jgi:hypothetical protein